jgi:hypothetical protein
MDCLAQRTMKIFMGCIWDSEVFITDFGWVVEMKIHMQPCDFQLLKTNLGLNFHARNKEMSKMHLDHRHKMGQVNCTGRKLKGIET